MMEITLFELLDIFPNSGKLMWIGLRPARQASIRCVDEAWAETNIGLQGDRYHSRNGKRQITLIQWEHLNVLSGFIGKPVMPELLRRNLAIAGINLLALKDRRFRIGPVVLQGSGLCQPCSKMEKILGAGAYNAMRGHGGITARIIEGGRLQVGDPVAFIAQSNMVP
jgi:MOSC domain-containing protein YiiM